MLNVGLKSSDNAIFWHLELIMNTLYTKSLVTYLSYSKMHFRSYLSHEKLIILLKDKFDIPRLNICKVLVI